MTRSRTRRPRAAHVLLVLAAAMAAVLLSACGGSKSSGSSKSSGGSGGATAVHGSVNGQTVQGLYGSLPTGGTPTGSGTITMGQITGDTPTYIQPIVPSANATDGTQFLVDQLFVPLYSLQQGGVLKVNDALSAAAPPVFSDGGRVATIHLRSGLKWSDGTPVTANDVLFCLALLRAAIKESAANWDVYTPGLFPDNVKSATAPNSSTVKFTFTRAYNTGFLLGDQLAQSLYPLPSTKWDVASKNGPHLNWRVPANATKIYNYINKAAQDVSTFASNPLWKTVDGPFTLQSFSATNGTFVLNRNPGYDLDGTVRYQTLRVETFTSLTSQLNALRAHGLDVAVVDSSQIGQVPELRSAGFSVYGYPNIGTFGFILNFKDPVNHFGKVISQLYVRQALAHLEDQPAYIQGIYKGTAAPAYGPLPSLPKTPYTPSTAGTATYPYSISAASKLLSSHGWKVAPGKQTTCVKPGTASDECGAGIPAGTPLKFNIVANPASEGNEFPLESEAFASAAKQAGIEIAIGSKTFNYQIQYYNDADAADDRYRSAWAVANWGEYPSFPYYTGATIFNSDGTSNNGGYDDPTANKLVNAALYGRNVSAATDVSEYLAKNLPLLYLPCTDVIDAVSNTVGGTSDSWLALTQDAFQPQFWYVKK